MCGQEHFREGEKKSTQTSALPSVQGAIFHTKESFEERKEKGRKKEILKCGPRKSRLEAPLLSLFPFSSLSLPPQKRDRMIVGHNRVARRWG